MKIEYALMSSNSTPMYLDFWPVVSKVWKIKFNVTPVLYYIDNNHDIDISDEYGIVKKFKPVDGIPISLQSLWIRYWGFTEFKDNVCILSDIDMIPMSKRYFLDQVIEIDDDKYAHINPCLETYGLIPSCYHICKGSTFSKILNLHDEYEKSIEFINSLRIGETIAGNDQWFADERYATNKILEYQNNNPYDVHLLKRDGGQNGYRLDRHCNYENEENVINDNVFDCHSPRPYTSFKGSIDKLVSLLIQ